MPEPRAQRPYMPDYGVDTPSWAPLPWSWATARLIAGRNYWLVTVSADARPHALPLWGVWDEAEARFAFSAGPRSRKARNLAGNAGAVVMTDDTVECVSVEGSATVVDDAEHLALWIDRYLAKYQPIAPDLSAAFLRQNLVFEFEPERAFAVIEHEDEFASRATRWVF